MNTLIVNLIFGSLTIIFFIGIVIMIRNTAKIRSFNNTFKSRMKEEIPLKLVYVRSGSQSDIIPLQSKPILQLPVHAEEMKLIAYQS